MKIFIILAAFAVAAHAALSHQEQWAQFKLEHSKKYQHVKEEQIRFNIFSENLRKIEKHNAKYAAGEVSYHMGINKFADLTSEEFMALLNSQITSLPNPNITSRLEADPNLSIPDSFDWRDKGAVAPVRDQDLPYSCGSCWAFSAAAVIEGQRFLQGGKLEWLSTQQLIDCSRSNGNQGCKGGFPNYAYHYVKQHGLCLDSDYPYKAVDSQCQDKCKPVIDTISGLKFVDASEEALQQAVATIGPISVVLYANDNWQFYSGGVFDDSECNGVLNHAVLGVAYGKANGKDIWIIKNSWGPNWGEKGYIKIVRGKNMCRLDSLATYPVL